MHKTHDTQGQSLSTFTLLGIGLAVGVALTVAISTFVLEPNSMSSDSLQNTANEPMYWVAPMDPNFQRDKPGLSPMGMDLVPVYANNTSSDEQDSPGTIQINPNVVNNLGVRTAKVQRKFLNLTIQTLGYVQYNEDTLVHVHPRVEGWIEVLNVKAAGEYVKKGEPLYALYSPELVNAQDEFLLAVKRANNNLIAAAKSRLKALQMPETAIEKLIASETVQQTVVFTAPQTGFIDNLNIREGFYVKPGMTLMSIGALDEVWVDAEIFERQSNLVKLGLPVLMTMEYLPGKAWHGKVDYIYPTLDASTRTLRVRLRFSNEDYFLKPNMFAQVSIFTGLPPMNGDAAGQPNIIVPSEAVIRTGSQNRVVLALGDGKFKSVEVLIGNTVEVNARLPALEPNTIMHETLPTGSYTEILSGLMDDDLVVTSAQFLLDSESSISSDFIRIGGEADLSDQMDREAEHDHGHDIGDMHSQVVDDKSNAVWVQATVDDAMLEDRMVRLTHGDIDAWGMPGMSMIFVVAEQVDMTKLEVGKTMHVALKKPVSGMFQVVGVKP
ncbi:MAG: Cu(I)/Ag(I) efflux system membrane fusion protein [Bermanella sp.]|jgi:Cu(I)/Ag(I) efflux system membrane fusion protein